MPRMPSVPNSSLVIVGSGWSGRSIPPTFSSLAQGLLSVGRSGPVTRHKSNVDFGWGNLDDTRAEWGVHHIGSNRQSGRTFFSVLQVHAQAEVGSNHAAQQGRAATYPDTNGGGHVAGNFKLGWHGCEFDRDLETDFGVGLGCIRGAEEERNRQGQKLQARICENVFF